MSEQPNAGEPIGPVEDLSPRKVEDEEADQVRGGQEPPEPVRSATGGLNNVSNLINSPNFGTTSGR